jgi:hypothetical protein
MSLIIKDNVKFKVPLSHLKVRNTKIRYIKYYIKLLVSDCQGTVKLNDAAQS